MILPEVEDFFGATYRTQGSTGYLLTKSLAPCREQADYFDSLLLGGKYAYVFSDSPTTFYVPWESSIG